jgi:phosphoserine aminotransferase
MFEEAEALLRELTGANENYEVLYLTGGASSQFFMAPMNLLNDNETAAYVNTGVWADKAIKEAKAFGNIVEAGIF